MNNWGGEGSRDNTAFGRGDEGGRMTGGEKEWGISCKK